MYSLTLINRNGYTIKKDFKTIKEAKNYDERNYYGVK